MLQRDECTATYSPPCVLNKNSRSVTPVYSPSKDQKISIQYSPTRPMKIVRPTTRVGTSRYFENSPTSRRSTKALASNFVGVCRLS